jgi:glycosyltransferase involved in cell wall biosynthesis
MLNPQKSPATRLANWLDAFLPIFGNLFPCKPHKYIVAKLIISVAMCTLNGSRFLQAQLDSIATQNRLPDELIVCDDGSSDGTFKQIEAFAAQAAFPVRWSVNERRLGSTKNFEGAIERCRGEIVILADQDDVWYPNKVDSIENAFLESDSTVATFSDADLINADSQLLGLRLWSTLGFTRSQQRQFDQGKNLDVLAKHPVITGATMAFRKELFPLLTPIPADDIHDRWMSFLLAACGRIRLIRQPLMQYRRHEHQQIGPGPHDFQAKMKTARSRGAEFYTSEIARYSQLLDYIRMHQCKFLLAQEAMKKLTTKLRHLKHRACLPHSKVARIPGLLTETINGRYWRYSGGWKSLAKDLVVR